jgi:predicted methyltransferase
MRRVAMERTVLAALSSVGLAATVAYAALGTAIPQYITAAIADSARPAADSQRDAERKPAECLAFAGVKPGDQVIELAPGRGYYTRLLSAVVGPKGKVIAVGSPPKPDAPPPPVQAIAADPHYSNVTVVLQPYAQVKLPSHTDVVWTTQNYHDFHNSPNLSVPTLNRAVFEALKHGGIYFVLDHAAEPGSGTRDTNTLHRIDEQTVKQEVTAAGFRLAGESDALRNKDDPHTAKVFDPSIRGHTDQFILKFRKP